MPTTFRARLTMTLSALSIGVLGLASLLIYVAIHWALATNLDEALLTLARTEMASAFDEPGNVLHVHDQAPVTVAIGHGGSYEKVSEIVAADGKVVASTSNLTDDSRLEIDPALVNRAIAGEAVFVDTLRAGREYRALYHPLTGPGGTRYAMVLAVARQPLEQTLGLIAFVLLIALVAGGGLAAVTAFGVSRRLTRPLDRIAATALAVGGTDLTARIPDVSGDMELRALVRLLNDMLGRLDAAFASQRRFVADASHELRSPLSNLRGTIEVALRHPRSAAEYQETLAVALQEIERLVRLVQGLLALSRAEAGRLTLDRRPTELKELASRSIDLCRARAAARDVRLRLDAVAPVTVDGDADRLREVLDNLLDNALRVAPIGSEVRVGVKIEDGRCVLEVEDCGPGLSDDERSRVFEPFARGAAAGGDGAGLGLAIARALTEAHGGSLAVRSAPGSGATFRIELPPAATSSRIQTESGALDP